MTYFDQIVKAAQQRNRKKIEQLLVQGISIDQQCDLALTPAGQLAKKQDWDAAYWLMKNYNADCNLIIYGAILGGLTYEQIKDPDKFNLCDAIKEILKGTSSIFLITLWLQAFAQINLMPIKVEHMVLRMRTQVIRGAAFSGNEELLSKLLNPEDKYYSEEHIREALAHAAQGGQKKLIDDLLLTNQSNRKDLLSSLAIGIGLGQQIEFAMQFKKCFPDLSLEEVVYGGLANEHFDFCLKLLNTPEIRNNSLSVFDLIHCAVQLKKFNFLNLLVSLQDPSKTNFSSEIYVAAKEFMRTPNELLVFASQFDSQEVVNDLFKALNSDFLNQLPTHVKSVLNNIKEQVAQVIRLKKQYCINSNQALVVLQNPKLIPQIQDKGVNNNHLVEVLMNSNLSLPPVMIKDLVYKLRKNQPRAQLINNLTHYAQQSFWWYNHQNRAKNLLQNIEETQSRKKVKSLVSNQLSLFKGIQPDDKDTAQHLNPIKNINLKDEFYHALEAYEADNTSIVSTITG